MKRFLAVSALGLSLLVTASGHAGAGGKSPSSAIAVTAGSTITSSTDDRAGVEFFKVTLGFADLLTLGYGVPDAFQNDPRQQSVGLCLLRPGTDDFTIATTPCQSLGDPDFTRAKLQYDFRAPKAGTYLIAIGIAQCVTSYTHVLFPCQKINAGTDPAPPTPYVLRVGLHSYTTLSLVGPRTVRAGTRATYRGGLRGLAVNEKKIVLQLRTGGRWKPVGSALTAENGSFKIPARINQRGRVRLRALFAGDTTHLSSRAPFALTVA